jgi:curved DNA-binding protein CbpA
MPRNYYLILGVPTSASSEDLRTAFRRRSKELHPDVSGFGSGPFVELQEAYAVLSDPVRRRDYDHTAGSNVTVRSAPYSRTAPTVHLRRSPDVILGGRNSRGQRRGLHRREAPPESFEGAFDNVFARWWDELESLLRQSGL